VMAPQKTAPKAKKELAAAILRWRAAPIFSTEAET
jgi:hypothetical protein